MTTRKGTNDSFDDFHQLIDAQNFSSLEEAEAFLKNLTNKRNEAPRDDFHGLSPEQMYRFLYYPFESAEVVSFSEQISCPITAPLLTLFHLLEKNLGEKGLKPTAKGNLPRKLCREIAVQYWGEAAYSERSRFRGVNREEDFFELHVVRLVAELSGLIRKYKGKFVLTKKCQALLNKEKEGELFFLLFKTYTKKFNWAYWDGFEEIQFIQESFLFTLYLISRYGTDWQSNGFYSDCYIQAFPILLREIAPTPYRKPEEHLKSCHTYRALVHFAKFLGFAKVEPIQKDELLAKEYRVQKLPLLDKLVHFH